jgi:solute carrier family 25 phosphate transporter 23/24/25/41
MDGGRGPARSNVEGMQFMSLADTTLNLDQGDDSLSAENKPPDFSPFIVMAKQPPVSNGPNHELAHGEDEEDDEGHHFLEGHTALKFLLAGGIAGAGGFIHL